MNERIKELAEQAHEFAVSKYEKRLETEKSSNVFFYKIKDKQFAELIVRECAQIAKEVDGDEGDDYQSGRTWAGIDVLKHFGVEE